MVLHDLACALRVSNPNEIISYILGGLHGRFVRARHLVEFRCVNSRKPWVFTLLSKAHSRQIQTIGHMLQIILMFDQTTRKLINNLVSIGADDVAWAQIENIKILSIERFSKRVCFLSGATMEKRGRVIVAYDSRQLRVSPAKFARAFERSIGCPPVLPKSSIEHLLHDQGSGLTVIQFAGGDEFSHSCEIVIRQAPRF